MNVKAVKYSELKIGDHFWTEEHEAVSEYKLYEMIKVDESGNKCSKWADNGEPCFTCDVPEHYTVYILDTEPVEKKWPEKMILVCRTEEEIDSVVNKWKLSTKNKAPHGCRIEKGIFKSWGYLDTTYKKPQYSRYTFIEASDYFGLNKQESCPSVEVAETTISVDLSTYESREFVTVYKNGKLISQKEYKPIIEKGSINMATYQVRATLEAENRAGVGMIGLTELLPITTIDAGNSQSAAFLAGTKVDATKIPDTEAHRLKVQVKEF